ncbi:MAG: single-stranded-DNA-specific exonuclease RecJ [Candidatus Omnitrophota bacterium]
MTKRWEIKLPDLTLREGLVSQLHFHPVTAQLLIHRGVRTASEARTFLSHDLSGCPDPFLLKDMDKAVFRLQKALKEREKLLIWGDYDVDGVTSTSLLVRSLRAFGFQVSHYIPNRLVDGYGLNQTILTQAKKDGIRVIISVDTGIAGHEAVDHLRNLGMDLILTDHHQPKEELPKAYAIINPLQKGCHYPFKHLSGVGLSYKLACALEKFSFPDRAGEPEDHLDLVAVGTIADVVPMLGENRILVYHGLRLLEKRKKAGLRALLSMGRVRQQALSPRDIAFAVGPRINASGRLGSAETALQLLLTDQEEEAKRLVRILEAGNQERRRIEKEMLKEAISKVEREVNFKHERVIVLEDAKWHPGIVGIIASRILNQFYRPTVIIALSGDRGRGSARSIQGFPLPVAFEQCKEFLDEFGGHALACGLTLRKESIQPFRESLNRIASRTLEAEDLVPTLSVDMEIPLETLNFALLEELESLAPYGSGNAEPLFLTKGFFLGNARRHKGEVRMEIREEGGSISSFHEVVVPSPLAKEMAPFLEAPVDLVYHPVQSREGDRKTLMLHVKDFSPSKTRPSA